MLVTGFGAAEAHEELLAHLAEALPPLFQFASPMPYVQLQQMLDEPNGWGSYCYEKGCFVEQLSDEIIDAVLQQLPQKSSPLSVMLFYPLDGAYTEVGEEETAFGGGRSSRLGVFIIAVCPGPELLEADRAWVRATCARIQALEPGAGAYVNSVTEFDQERVRATYGHDKYERLAAIKATYDPDNVFHRNANIRPAVAGAR